MVSGMGRKSVGDEGSERIKTKTILTLQEYTTFHVKLGQTHGHIPVRKSLLRAKVRSHFPARAPPQKGLPPAAFYFSVALFHA